MFLCISIQWQQQFNVFALVCVTSLLNVFIFGLMLFTGVDEYAVCFNSKCFCFWNGKKNIFNLMWICLFVKYFKRNFSSLFYMDCKYVSFSCKWWEVIEVYVRGEMKILHVDAFIPIYAYLSGVLVGIFLFVIIYCVLFLWIIKDSCCRSHVDALNDFLRVQIE